MRVVAAILAAGKSTRIGLDKTLATLGGRPVWQWSYDTYRAHPGVSQVIMVASSGNHAEIAQIAEFVILGGQTRQQSVRAAIDAASDSDVLLLHDAARPFVTPDVISRVIEAIGKAGAAAAACPVVDTIKQIGEDGIRTLDRTTLVAMQTPQGAKTALLKAAHEAATREETDDLALIEAIGIRPEIVNSPARNFKITSLEDLERARMMVRPMETRVGLGYDVHPFSDDPTRTLMLGGVLFEGHAALDGHSDADVLLHAATDALLGAAGLGDIGQHFSNTDPRWRNEPSLTFLRAAGRLLAEAGWVVVNLDVSIVAETPKIMGRAAEMRQKMAEALGLEADRISVKATTNERLGFVGRGEGIAALATAAIRRGD